MGKPCELDLTIGRIVCSSDNNIEFLQVKERVIKESASTDPFTEIV
jgi:hypothetical protein